ncbi:MAG: YHYH protein [Isosphaeraceae bacterium]
MPRFFRGWPAVVVGLALALGRGDAALAHDGHEHEDPASPALARGMREWTHASGRHTVLGAFVSARGDQVQIRKADGGLVDAKLEALSHADRQWVRNRLDLIARLNAEPKVILLSQRGEAPASGPAAAEPPQLSAFRPFADKVKLRWDDRFFYVESNGIPDHPMMVGITAWQQQVPIPQPYTGANAWQVPLRPVPARRPLSAKENFFRGAIALAVNGIPIFNPIKNDGRTDTLLAGELDDFGGHCGRADDYHYHIAPVHLEAKAGKGKPLAYALDGYPVYGYDEPDGSKVVRLDTFNGHESNDMPYHYHATKTYPYLNGGFHGEVTERGGQVDPQPRAEPVREALPPLRGARIVGFESPGPNRFTLTYEVRGRKNVIRYTLGNDAVFFSFVDADGRTTTETYPRRGAERGPRRGGPEGDPPPRRRPPPRLLSALDGDKDGELSPEEVAAAPRSILSLDRDGDGELTPEEIGPADDGEGEPEPRPAPRRGEPPPPREDAPKGQPRPQGGRGPNPQDPNRRPWIQVHAAEMDADRDGTLTRVEILAEADRTFAGYDGNGDGKLSRDEYETGGGVRSAMGGFIRQHSAELDADGDGAITREEVRANATRMFDRADRDQDGKLSPAELAAPAGPRPAGGEGPQRPAQTKGQQGGRPAEPTKGQRGRNPGAGRANARQTDPNEPPPFHTEVPKHPFDVILGRPTDRSVSLSVVSYESAEGFVAFGTSANDLKQRSGTIGLPAGTPVELTLDALEPDAEYHYRLMRRTGGAKEFQGGEVRSFHTQRPAGKPFRFTIQADSHLDMGTEPALYVRTLENALARRPDFHVDLGDTFMTDKFARHADSLSQYRAQRYYFGLLCHSAPLFLVLGNHDGETGARLDGTPRSMPVWSAETRKRYFPNPFPDAFYTGNDAAQPYAGKLGDYYAWHWGDALFVVLDPFWYTTARRVDGNDYWARTLGEAQYRWLARTLETSRARFTFVFIHHLVGGSTREGRGGAEASAFFEWGPRPRRDRRVREAAARLARPVHDLLVKHGVSAVFHGHDHFYARQERDGVVHQLVPQPGNPRTGEPGAAAEYSYRQGEP